MKKTVILFVIALSGVISLSGCRSYKEKKAAREEQKQQLIFKQKQDKAIDSYIENLSVEEKVSQMFIINLDGNKDFIPVERYGSFKGNKREGKALVPGGYLFFSYNLQDNIEGIMKFTDSIREYCISNEIIVPFLAADQEGGLVNRLRGINGPLPSCQRVSEKLSVEEAGRLYELQAVQMKALGFDMNLAPVIEICTDTNRDFLSGRSFGNAEQVNSYGDACISAYEEKGIGTVVKHFPGNTNTDPHSGLPEIKLSMEELSAQLEPFAGIGKKASGVLMSHARTEALDGNVPACLSEKWVTEKLRNQYGYQGIIFSDDIFMGALANNGYGPEKAALRAVEAGINCIMISEKRFADAALVIIKKAVEDEAFMQKVDYSVKKILEYKAASGFFEFLPVDDTAKDYELEMTQYFEAESIENRVNAFNAAKAENIQMYRTYFLE